ncbi:MAG: hypothetical protein H7232_19985 [Aeromicrobium sp.]|nr:hypothetical protein [Burkholderiales bacterium]
MASVGQNEKSMGWLMVGCGAFLSIGLSAMYFIALLDGGEEAFWSCSRLCGLYNYLTSLMGVTGLKLAVAVGLISVSLGSVVFGIRLLTGRAKLDSGRSK